jgi:hypothetical protein
VLITTVLVAGCDGAEPASPTEDISTTSTTSSTSTTTTTVDPGLTCDEIGDQAADLLRRILTEVENVDASDLTERERWPAGLVELQAEGRDLDLRVAAAGCDPGTIQETALRVLEDVSPEGRVAEILVEVLTGA